MPGIMYLEMASTPICPVAGTGRGDDGEVLPPGLYVFRIVVDLKPNKKVGTGVIGLAY